MSAMHGEGLPGWVELSTDDPAAAAAFYGELFGWTHETSGEGAREYRVASSRGRQVAGIAGKMNPGQPTAWLLYFGCDDLPATIAAVKEAGGRVYMEPMEMPGGTYTFASDAVDAPLGLMQAAPESRFEAFGEPGDLVWFELQSQQPADQAAAFYEKVFGWRLGREVESPDMTYLTFTGAGQEIPSGGIFSSPEMPDYLGGYSLWTATFSVEDVPASAARAESLGAEVAMLETGTLYGDFAALRDPQGALFVIMKPAMPAA